MSSNQYSPEALGYVLCPSTNGKPMIQCSNCCCVNVINNTECCSCLIDLLWLWLFIPIVLTMVAVGVVFLIKKFRDKKHLQRQLNFASFGNNLVYQPNKYPVNYNPQSNVMPYNPGQYQPPNIVQNQSGNRQQEFPKPVNQDQGVIRNPNNILNDKIVNNLHPPKVQPNQGNLVDQRRMLIEVKPEMTNKENQVILDHQGSIQNINQKFSQTVHPKQESTIPKA